MLGASSPIQWTKGLFLDNVAPRKAIQMKSATSPLFAKLHGSHMNAMEGLPIIFAAALGAMQAGVSAELVGDYCQLYAVLRAVYTILYVIQTNWFVAINRTTVFFGILAIPGKLFLLAAAQA